MKITSELLIFLPLAFGIGIALSVQTAINTQLRDHLNSPIQAAFFSFLIGTILLALLAFFQHAEKPSFSSLVQIPWFLWIGGALGVYAISMSIYTAPKTGLLTLSGLIILGQLLSSVVLDHFGWLGVERVPVNWQRITGIVVILIGVVLTLQH